jgi:hypothetical protein
MSRVKAKSKKVQAKSKKVQAKSKGKKVQVKHTTVRVQKTLKIGQQLVYEKDAEEEMDTRAFETEPAKVSVGKGITIALAKYESARVDVHVSIPCYLEEVHEVYQALNGWVSRKVEDEARALRAYRDELRRSRLDSENEY